MVQYETARVATASQDGRESVREGEDVPLRDRHVWCSGLVHAALNLNTYDMSGNS